MAGHVKGTLLFKHYPKYASESLSKAPLGNVKIEAFGPLGTSLGETYTSSSGYFSIYYNQPQSEQLTLRLRIYYKNTDDLISRDEDSDELFEIIEYTHGSQGYTYVFSELLLNDSNDDILIDAANMMFHIPKIRGYFSNLGSNHPRIAVNLREGSGVSGEYNTSANILKFGTMDGYQWARTAEIIYHEYTHHIIHEFYNGSYPGDTGTQAQAIDEGISDYFACSIQYDQNFGESVGYSRTLLNTYSYMPGNNDHWNGQVIGGACWDVRSAIGATFADKLVYKALQHEPHTFNEFADAMKKADYALFQSSYQAEIVQGFANHGISVSLPMTPVVSFTSGWGEIVELSWTSGGNYVDHYVLKKEYNFGSGWSSPNYLTITNNTYTDNNVKREKRNADLTARYSVKSVDNFDYDSYYSNTISTTGQSLWKESKSTMDEDNYAFGLQGNYPNPFNPETNIHFQVPVESSVVLKVYNVLGKEIKEIANQNYSMGKHIVKFNGSRLPSGIYIYTMNIVALDGTGRNYFETKKMQLIK